MLKLRGYKAFNQQKGSLSLRIAFYVVFALLIMAVALYELNYYQELGEKTLVDGTVRNMQISIRARILANYASSQEQLNKKIIDSNPVEYLKTKPVDYVGEVKTADRPMQKGVWYFHIETKDLVYIPASTDHLYLLTETADDLKLSENREHLKELRFYLDYDGTNVIIKSRQQIEWCEDILKFYDANKKKKYFN